MSFFRADPSRDALSRLRTPWSRTSVYAPVVVCARSSPAARLRPERLGSGLSRKADLRRNAVSNLRFSSVIYVSVNSLGKSSFSLPCLQLRPERLVRAVAQSTGHIRLCMLPQVFLARLVLLASPNRTRGSGRLRKADLRRNAVSDLRFYGGHLRFSKLPRKILVFLALLATPP